MKNQMDLYSTLSTLLGKKISPNEELSLSDAEWARLSVAEQDQIAQLIEVAMHHPEIMFYEQDQSSLATLTPRTVSTENPLCTTAMLVA